MASLYIKCGVIGFVLSVVFIEHVVILVQFIEEHTKLINPKIMIDRRGSYEI
jgi:hypothetical protein